MAMGGVLLHHLNAIKDIGRPDMSEIPFTFVYPSFHPPLFRIQTSGNFVE